MRAEEGRAPPNSSAREPMSHADNPLVRAIQRTPTGVQSKLVVALLGAVVLLVVVGLLGIRAIADSNNRADALRVLQQRATAYRAIQASVEEIRVLLGLRAGGPDLQVYLGGAPSAARPGSGRGATSRLSASTRRQTTGPRSDRSARKTLGSPTS
jgi:hypothetical protein